MKHSRNCLLAFVCAFVLIFSMSISLAHAEDVIIPCAVTAYECQCPESERIPRYHYGDRYCYRYHNENPPYHMVNVLVTVVCENCDGRITAYPDPIKRINLTASRGTRFLDYDSTHHWYSTPIHWSCSETNCDGGTTKYENETKYVHSSSSNWVDGGHSGGSHNFYRYCDTCGYRFDSLTVPCPGGDNHASIYQIPNLPIESETE